MSGKGLEECRTAVAGGRNVDQRKVLVQNNAHSVHSATKNVKTRD